MVLASSGNVCLAVFDAAKRPEPNALTFSKQKNAICKVKRWFPMTNLSEFLVPFTFCLLSSSKVFPQIVDPLARTFQNPNAQNGPKSDENLSTCHETLSNKNPLGCGSKRVP